MEDIRIEFIKKLDNFIEELNPGILDIEPFLAERIYEKFISPNYSLIKKNKKNTNMIKEKNYEKSTY